MFLDWKNNMFVRNELMGIQNLLKNLKSITKQRQHISHYSGEIAAVDALCWYVSLISIHCRLHQAMSTCGKEICNGVETTKYCF